METESIEALKLKKIINQLCSVNIRSPLKESDCTRWLNQFQGPEEQLLGLLILRYMIYRSNDQLISCFKKSLKTAVSHFCKKRNIKIPGSNWLDILSNKHSDINFIIGPSKSDFSNPGRSGEVITQLLRKTFSDVEVAYPSDCLTTLKSNEVFLLVDDAMFTSTQIKPIVDQYVNLAPSIQSGANFALVLGMSHAKGSQELRNTYSQIPIFCGEDLTEDTCFEKLSESWVKENRWPGDKSQPLDVYSEIIKRAEFKDNNPLGFGSLGALVAFERHIPDNALQILWDRSDHWNKLI
jgi:hypothetical protein